MTREIRDVPPAPRHVRWGPVLWCRWPLGLAGAGLAVYGSLVGLLFSHVDATNPELLLDEGPVEVATATITGVRETRASWDGHAVDRYEYLFRYESRDLRGASLGLHGDYAEGDRAEVEFLRGDPGVSRLRGTHARRLGELSRPVFGLVVLPGVLLVLLWLQGVMDLRLLLGRGDVAAAELLRIESVPWVVPVMLRVQFRFRDHHARWREGSHWVRARSTLGQRLSAAPDHAVLVHDRRRPARHRLAAADDFVRAAPAPREGRPAPHA